MPSSFVFKRTKTEVNVSDITKYVDLWENETNFALKDFLDII